LHFCKLYVKIIAGMLHFELGVGALSSKTNEKFTQRLKELRVGKGITQQEIATLFNVTRPCICYWETGKRVPDYQTLIALGDFYDVSVDYLLGCTDTKKPILNDDGDQFEPGKYLDISLLDEEGKKQILDYYEYLLGRQQNTKTS